MLFNSLDFAFFLPIVFILYWFVLNKNLKFQNILIVFASYIFYGWWDWRFLSLIFFSTILDFIVGVFLLNEQRESKRKFLLFISVIFNLGLLGLFKYYNFFIESFIDAFSLFGTNIQLSLLKWVLPVGISFYTFQTMSYTIDVYRKQLIPTKSFIDFAAFVSFFPQLVAGPIERASNLLPQFYKKRVFDYEKAIDGVRQIAWGFFKKMVVADNAALVVNQIFNDYQNQSGINLLIGVFFFAFQIYGDFSGYSDIAIGVSRLFGFDLKQNFAFPYFSRDIAEFWRRWHISLSTWFRDYLYIPLGGSKGGMKKAVRNTFIIFIVSGFWHGANWTFIVWGLLNALYFIPLLLTKSNRNNIGVVAADKWFPTIKELMQISLTFMLTLIAWVFFRATSVEEALLYIKGMFSLTLFSLPTVDLKPFIFIVVLIIIEWYGRRNLHALEAISKKPRYIRSLTYILIFIMILLFATSSKSFIYFQF